MQRAINPFFKLGPNIAEIAIASIRGGKAKKISVILINKLSSSFDDNEEILPIAKPTIEDIVKTKSEEQSDIREPTITLLKTSLPNSSVPIKCILLGGVNLWGKFTLSVA